MSGVLETDGGGRNDITAGAASELAWRHAFDRALPPAMQWGAPGRVVVLAPHPDDEVLGAGGTMRQLVRRGFCVVVLAVTDGESAQPSASAASRQRLAATRSRERRAALASLGLGDVTVVRARLSDGAVEDSEQWLTEIVIDVLSRAHPGRRRAPPVRTWCVAAWRRDGHPDHEAVGRSGAAASAFAGARFLEYPVWAWQWLHPDDRRFPWRQLRIEELSGSTQRLKQQAIRAFASQIAPFGTAQEPILSAEMLRRFGRRVEGFLQEEGSNESRA